MFSAIDADGDTMEVDAHTTSWGRRVSFQNRTTRGFAPNSVAVVLDTEQVARLYEALGEYLNSVRRAA